MRHFVTLYFSFAIRLQRPPEHPIPLLPLDCLQWS